MAILGENLRTARQKKGWTLTYLAARVGYDRICLSRVEYGTQNLEFHTLCKLAAVLNVPFAGLFSRSFCDVLREDAASLAYQPDNYLLIFKDNVNRALHRHGIPQNRIYTETGLSEAMISHLLKGTQHNPTVQTLCTLTFLLPEPLSQLFTRTDFPEQEVL